jgi:hypothetical protein
MHTIYGPLNVQQTTKALETLQYYLHLVSNKPEKNIFENNVDPNYEFSKDNQYCQLASNNNSLQINRLQP